MEDRVDNQSADGRTVSATTNSVTVTYQNSANAQGIKGFTVTETYSLAADGSLVWKQDVKNTSTTRLVIGDWGIPIPGNELWKGGDSIYETRVLTHSYVGKNGSYVTLERPSGQGPFIAMTADTATGSGFEYQDRWRTEEVGSTSWAWNAANESSNIKGLNVYYPHSMAIQKTNRGYLGSTSVAIAAGATKSYTYRIGKVTDDASLKQSMFDQGLLDATVVPGLIVPVDRSAEMAFRVKGTITSVTARNRNDLKGATPTNPAVTFSRDNGDYRIYKMTFDRTQLGANDVTVAYTDSAGRARQSVLQFSVIDSVAGLVDSHAKFMVDKTQWKPSDGLAASDIRNYTFDDWMMNAADGSLATATNAPQGRRNQYNGYWGLGDDWGLPHGQFLAEKLVALPDATQIKALDDYLQKAVWENLMGNTSPTATPKYTVYDFWEQGKPGSLNTTPHTAATPTRTFTTPSSRCTRLRSRTPRRSHTLTPPSVSHHRLRNLQRALRRPGRLQLGNRTDGRAHHSRPHRFPPRRRHELPGQRRRGEDGDQIPQLLLEPLPLRL